NRGEIALRIIRACKELGIDTVAVHSEPDVDSLHVRFADEEVCIGPGPSNQSYLNIPAIISAAEVTNVDAIHPGYGFLAENAYFAEICESCDIKFIGPSSQILRQMGDKVVARGTMANAGVPIIPGSDGPVSSITEARQTARKIGYPTIIKAAAGGGGRGMRIVRSESELEISFHTAKAEAEAAFTNSELYMERWIENPRHIEIQLLGDEHGNLIHLGERDCSLQRRYQKLLEESPSPAVDPRLRKQLGEMAIKGARSINYQSTGTVEFLLDEEKNFYFMEMNTRIQVEHPVTEMVIGMDLIKEQIRLAAGERLRCSQDKITLHGHAIECRINAEDPDKGFQPAPGTITSFHVPGGPGVRVDTHVYARYHIPPYYDSLLAKVITYGRTRQEAIGRMERALEELVIEGVPTTVPFHQRVIRDERFRRGEVHTGVAEDVMAGIKQSCSS
ncbi:MAG: acetyl-CoA carboxylase biotin carboxylase subunit, partial [bacterium]